MFDFIINPKEKPFDDIEVRKAINLAIDKNKIIQLAMNGKEVQFIQI